MDLSFLTDIDAKINADVPLSRYTTFQLGGPCPAVIECSTANVLRETIIRLRNHNIPFILMGFGSNILASDHGIRKVVVRYNSDIPIIKRIGNAITVDAATPLDALVFYTIEQGFEGLTSMIGIPGTVGGAITGNAGAYGEQISDRLAFITVLRTDNSVVTLPKESVKFSYRDSEFKHNGDIVLTADFDLTPSPNMASLHAKRDEIIATRKFKLDFWKEHPCAGSFFRNVEPTSKAGPRKSAGWFLEEAGAKNLSLNGAHTYAKHANIIMRENGSKSQAVYDLTVKMASLVKEKFGIELIREVRLLGKFDNAAECKAEDYW